jgi:chaperone BCS1
MTTNCLPKMDPALIRPGRVDLQIKFTLATHDQIYDIFNRMYSTEAHIARSQQMCQSTATDTHVSKTTYNDVHSLDPTLTSLNIGSFEPKEGVVSSDRLDNMAKEFASKVPSGTFSPAEIQGFLLGRMADPVSTLQDVDQWVSEQLKTQKV